MNDNNILYQSNKSNYGEIKIADDVISSIAAIAAKDVDGVKDTVGSNTNEIMSKFIKKNTGKGVRCQISDNKVIVDISLIIKYGYSIKDTSNKVQEKIKNAIENMTDFTVTDVNINIASIDITD